MATKYLISTTMGDSILDPSSQVYVQVSPFSYVRKKAIDLNIGDMVLFEKPWAKTELEDVDPHLTKSPRYALAKESLHEHNSRGEFIPKLRTLLLKGMADRGLIDRHDIDARSLYEADDFSKEEYERMEEHISDTLKRYNIDRAKQTVGHWLRGETLAPSDWEIFGVLENEFNPEFANFRPYEEDPKSMYFNYQLYVNIRRGIMRYLNDCRGTTVSLESMKKEKPKISLSPEYAIVFQHFLDDKDDKNATARITDITKVLKRPHLLHVKETNKFLGEGILTEEMGRLKELLRNYKDVMEYKELLRGYIDAFVEDFDYDMVPESNIITLPTEYPLSNRFIRTTLSSDVLPGLLRHFGEDLDDWALFLEKHVNDSSERKKYIKDFIEAVRRGFLERDMDSQFKYSRGTALSLLESYYRVRKTIPRRVFQHIVKCKEFYNQLTENVEDWQIPGVKPQVVSLGKTFGVAGHVNPSRVANKVKEMGLKEGRQLIEDKYGIDINYLGLSYKGGYFFSEDLHEPLNLGLDPVKHKPIKKIISGREFIEEHGIDCVKAVKKSVDELKERLNESRSFYIKRDHALKVLKEFNLGRILDQRWQDFLWEDV